MFITFGLKNMSLTHNLRRATAHTLRGLMLLNVFCGLLSGKDTSITN